MSSWEYLLTFLGTAGVVTGLTPLARKIALAYNVTDNPDGPGGRKTQRTPVPYLGGLAMAGGMTAVVVVGTLIRGGSSTDLSLMLALMIPALALAVVGFLDDKRGLGVRSRLFSQIIAGSVISAFIVFGGTKTSILGSLWLDVPITVLWVVGIVNAMNFMDNMDGLSSSVGAIASLTFFVIASVNGQFLIAALSLALAGACSGFLLHNWAPAKIYMGDAGALFLGCLLAVIAIRLDLRTVDPIASIAAKVLVLALPIADTTTVVFSRIRRGVSPLTGGRDHLSHRISGYFERRGVTDPRANTRKTVSTMALIAVVSCLIALLVLTFAN